MTRRTWLFRSPETTPTQKRGSCEFMRQIGVDPFDLGPSTVSYVMDPQGPLWAKAVSELEMRELVGWLSGDG